VVVFAAFGSAAGMVEPVVECTVGLGERLCVPATSVGAAIVFTIILTGFLLVATAALARTTVGQYRGYFRVVFSLLAALVPLGFAMWLAHYSFHFFTSYSSALAVGQRLAADLGLTTVGTSNLAGCCCAPAPDWLLISEIVCLQVGFLWSLYRLYEDERATRMAPSSAVLAALPGGLVATACYGFGIWLFLQPMEMRGM
jgi:hypothetical protein